MESPPKSVRFTRLSKLYWAMILAVAALLAEFVAFFFARGRQEEEAAATGQAARDQGRPIATTWHTREVKAGQVVERMTCN